MITMSHIIIGFALIGFLVTCIIGYIALQNAYYWFRNIIFTHCKTWQKFTVFCVYYEDFKKYFKERNPDKFEEMFK